MGSRKKGTRSIAPGLDPQGQHYRDTLGILTNDLFAGASKFRKLLDENAEFEMKQGPTLKFWKDNVRTAQKFKTLASIGAFGKFEDMLPDLQALNASLPSGEYMQRDHDELNPFGMRINALMIKLQEMKAQKEGKGLARGGISQKSYEAQSTDRYGEVTIPMNRDLDSMIRDLQELAVAEKAISRYYAGRESTPGNLSSWIQKLKSQTTGKIILNKRQKIEGSPTDHETISFTDHNLHDNKSDAQHILGDIATDIIYGREKQSQNVTKKQKDDLKKVIKNMGLHIEGSRTFYSAYRDGYFDLFDGKKTFKKVQGGSRVTLSKKKKGTFKKTQDQLRKVAIQAGYAKAAWKEAQAASYQKKETKHGNIAKSLIGIRSKVNRKLPAEIRRNMGRPALINRTGRFSNSAVLAQLRQTVSGKTLMARYTYMLNPYETFENTGERQWRRGYNPKPLISKSIRKLAEAETREKFGIGITTRRI